MYNNSIWQLFTFNLASILLNSISLWSLQWRHNEHDGVSNHQPHGCLLNRLFRRRNRWIPRTKGQLRGKCFHLMTSSCVWFHMAWLLLLMLVLTGSLFYSYSLSGNDYGKTSPLIIMGTFCLYQFITISIDLNMCLRHWNQRWFGDAAFPLPSGKQWDHRSPWWRSWLPAGAPFINMV